MCLCAKVVLPYNENVRGREVKYIASTGHGSVRLGLTCYGQLLFVGKGTLWSLGGMLGSPEISCGNGCADEMICAWWSLLPAGWPASQMDFMFQTLSVRTFPTDSNFHKHNCAKVHLPAAGSAANMNTTLVRTDCHMDRAVSVVGMTVIMIMTYCYFRRFHKIAKVAVMSLSVSGHTEQFVCRQTFFSDILFLGGLLKSDSSRRVSRHNPPTLLFHHIWVLWRPNISASFWFSWFRASCRL